MYFYIKLERRAHYCYVFLGFLSEWLSISVQICVSRIPLLTFSSLSLSFVWWTQRTAAQCQERGEFSFTPGWGSGGSGNGWWHCLYDTISVFWEEAPEIFIRFSKVPVPKIGLNCGFCSFSQFLRASHHLQGCEGIFRASLHLSFSTCRNCGEGGGKATIGVLAVSRKGCSGWSGQSCPTLGAPVFLIQLGPLRDISPLSTSSFPLIKCIFGQENTT